MRVCLILALALVYSESQLLEGSKAYQCGHIFFFFFGLTLYDD